MRWAPAVAVLALAACNNGTRDLCTGRPPRGCIDGVNGSYSCESGSFHEMLCEGGAQCVDGECRAKVCAPSVFFCDRGVADVCDASGTRETRTDCGPLGAVCVVQPLTATCLTRACAPSTVFCSADLMTVQKCAPDGMSSNLVAACDDPGQRGNLCLGGACHDRCSLVEAKDRSTLGCRFVAAPLMGGAPSIEIGNPQTDLPATVTVQPPSGAPLVGTVPPGGFLSLRLSQAAPGFGMGLPTGLGRAIVVSSTLPVYAFLHEDADSRTLVIHPEHALSSRYLAATGADGQVLAAVATAANTQVTITPTADVAAGGSIPASASGVPIVHTLQRGDVLYLAAASASASASLSGSRVTASAPIAVEVFGDGEGSVPGADTLGERALLIYDSLVIMRDAGSLTTSAGTMSLSAGAQVPVGAGQLITSTVPMLVLQTSGGANATVLPPVEQWRTVGFSPGSFIDLACDQAAVISVSGTTVPLAAAGGGYQALRAMVTPGPVVSNLPFAGLSHYGPGVLPVGYGLEPIHP